MCLNLSLFTLCNPVKPSSDRILSALMPFQPNCLMRALLFFSKSTFLSDSAAVFLGYPPCPQHIIEWYTIPALSVRLIQNSWISFIASVFGSSNHNRYSPCGICFAFQPQSMCIITTYSLGFSVKWQLAPLCGLIYVRSWKVKQQSQKSWKKDQSNFYFSQ